MSSAFSLNLQERQAVAIQAMLVLHQSRPSMRGAVGVDSSLLHSSFSSSSSSALLPQGCASWKILIFDDVAKDILGPLMTVGTLRRQGVTLNLPLKSRRSPVIEAPAVYLLAPTEENIQLLLDELQQKLYAFYFFNFTDSLSDDLMQLLAKGAVEAVGLHSFSRGVCTLPPLQKLHTH
ncbi:sec1 family protein, partial [Cystoisospora suis]